jgi:hypothetical protein
MTPDALIKSELIWRRILGFPPGAVRLTDWKPERRTVPHSTKEKEPSNATD